jgi:hypothetical protein
MPRRLEVKMKLRYTYQAKMANEMNLLDIESDLTVGSCGNVNISVSLGFLSRLTRLQRFMS